MADESVPYKVYRANTNNVPTYEIGANLGYGFQESSLGELQNFYKDNPTGFNEFLDHSFKGPGVSSRRDVYNLMLAGQRPMSEPITTSGFVPGFSVVTPEQQAQAARTQLINPRPNATAADFAAPTAPAQYPGEAVDISKKYQQGAEAARAAGVTSPSNYEGAVGMFNQFLPAQQGMSGIDNFISQDPYLGSVVKGFQDYLGEANQKTTLAQEYQNLLKSSGIEGIDLQLVDMRKVLDGVEDDLRLEIQKSGTGMATESQIAALSSARSKVLLKNYNALLDLRNNKAQYLDTMMNLNQQDRQRADQLFETKMNFGFRMSEISQKMRQSAVENLERVAKTLGWDGVFEATQNDPYVIANIERTYGLPTGGLQQAALRDSQIRATQKQSQDLDTQYKQAQIYALNQKQTQLTEVSPGATLYNTQTGKAVFTAPTAKQISGTTSNGSGSGKGGVFTNTQINKGAANAGVGIDQFKSYDTDTKNWFINNTTALNQWRKLDDSEKVKQVNDSKTMPQKVKEVLLSSIPKQPSKEKSGFVWWNPLTWFKK